MFGFAQWRRAARASLTKPSISPPSMSAVAFFAACGPPAFLSFGS